MRRYPIRRFYLFSILLTALVTALNSCSSSKKIKYFQDIPDSGYIKQIERTDYTPLTIQSGDIMNILIETIDPMATTIVNGGNLTPGGASSMPGGTGASSILSVLSGGNQTESSVSGFLVDKDGYIEMPVLGRFKAAGSTTAQLKDTVAKIASKYYKNPTILVRFANFKVNVIGEVLKPGQYIMPEEKESILDAIAMAGDLTIFGKRENVLLVRENADGTKTAYRINLKKSSSLASSIFYLRQNDVLYIEPRKAKSDATDASQAKYFSIAGALLSVLIIVATRIK